MKQTGLTQHVIDTVVLYDGVSKGKFTPSKANPLVKDNNGEPLRGMFRYSSVAGMLTYMSGYNRTDVALALKIFARYMFSPKQSRELALNRLVHYLRQKNDHGLVLNPNYDVCKVNS